MTSGDCAVAAARESKKTGQRPSKDIISEHEHASCVTHERHLLQFYSAKRGTAYENREGGSDEEGAE